MGLKQQKKYPLLLTAYPHNFADKRLMESDRVVRYLTKPDRLNDVAFLLTMRYRRVSRCNSALRNCPMASVPTQENMEVRKPNRRRTNCNMPAQPPRYFLNVCTFSNGSPICSAYKSTATRPHANHINWTICRYLPDGKHHATPHAS